MADTPKVYVICDKNCKFEGMTKEQIYAAIVQAVNEGTIGDIDTGFITTIKTINGFPLRFFVGEQAAYDALTDEEKINLFAIITNDTTKEGLLEAIETLKTDAEEMREGVISGAIPAGKAKNLIKETKYFDIESSESEGEAGFDAIEYPVPFVEFGKTYVFLIGFGDPTLRQEMQTFFIHIPKADTFAIKYYSTVAYMVNHDNTRLSRLMLVINKEKKMQILRYNEKTAATEEDYIGEYYTGQIFGTYQEITATAETETTEGAE